MKEKTVREWLDEIFSAKKREDSYRQFAEKVIKLYEAEKAATGDERPFLNRDKSYHVPGRV